MRKETPVQAPVIPALVEFKVNGVLWRCNRFDLLAAEFPITVEQLPAFQPLVAAMSPRSWLIVRRLFGLQPVVPPANAEVEDLQTWPREALRESLGLSRPQLQAELDAVRGALKSILPQADTPPPPPKKELKEEFEFSDDELLVRYGLPLKFSSMDEKAWFAHRVRDYEKILNEKFTAVLARNALMAELRLRQLDEFLNSSGNVSVGGPEWKSSLKLRQEIDKGYQDQIEQLRGLCPWAMALAGKHSFTGNLSDVTRGIQLGVTGDLRLIDGIFTATEVRVECRRSVQAPDPRYRAGLVTFLNAAKAGLWDPNWKPPFEFSLLRHIDAGWKAGFVAAAEADGARLPDLEQTGPAGEFEPLAPPPGPSSSTIKDKTTT